MSSKTQYFTKRFANSKTLFPTQILANHVELTDKTEE